MVSIIQRLLCNLLCRPAPVGDTAGTDAGLAAADGAPAKDQPTKRARRKAPRGGGPEPA